MPTVVLMSDIHGNLTALQTVQRSLPPHDRVIVAGDLCLEGPRPAEVLDALQEWRWSLLLGNTDRDIVEGPSGLKEEKAALVAWTRERLGPQRLRLLADLPREQRISQGDEELLVVHANPLNLDDQLHPDMSEKDLQPYLEGMNASLLAFGHLHIPYLRPVSGILLMDVSSVGHPKDRDLRAAYTVVSWDREGRKVTQVRVPYDVNETVRQLQQSDMPGADEQAASLLKASY